MRTMTKVLTVAATLLLALSLAAPLEASCGTLAQIRTANAAGQFSHIINTASQSFVADEVDTFAGTGPYGPYTFSYDPTRPAPPLLSSAADITFWRTGTGDPAVGNGDDNGVYDMIATGGFYFSGYPPTSTFGGYLRGGRIFGTWQPAGIDGCVGANSCMCLLISDQDGANGDWAILGGMSDANFNTFLDIGGTDGVNHLAPILLVNLDRPSITGSRRDAVSLDVELDVTLLAPSGGVYTKDGCACGPVGFKVLQQIVPRGSMPPSDPGASLWSEPNLDTGGPQPVTSFGSTVHVLSACASNTDVYLTTQLVFDSGIETPVVSAHTMFRCAQCTGIDNDGDGFCTEASAGVAADCNDDNPDVHPNAAQICDGLNNDCNHPNWPATDDTNEVDHDGDGLSECAGDCDETRLEMFPGAPEICDGIRNDCSNYHWPEPSIDEIDQDGDGFRPCELDCDDSAATVFPGAEQICDGRNNDCSDPYWPIPPVADRDTDGDGFTKCQGDCNESDATVYPGAPELCNGTDDDCDGNIDYGPGMYDTDGDGVADQCDNCFTVPNETQADTNDNGIGDACERIRRPRTRSRHGGR